MEESQTRGDPGMPPGDDSTPVGGGDPAASAGPPARARFQPDHMLPDPETGRDMLYRMLLIRRFEERAGEMYARAKIGGFLHLCIGEEATVVGTVDAMRQSDYLISTYREHGQVLARGSDPNAVMAELFGRVDGVSKGRGGSMHMFDLERRFMGGYGIVGGHLPIAAGLALAADYTGAEDAVVCMLGDGASNQGTFGETLNLAALWKLPVVFIIVNNQFGMGTAVARHSAVTDLSAKGEGFGVPGTRCDGMDVLDVQSCVRTALEHVRNERHPLLIEAVTYRFRGHSMADPEEYRTKDEVEQWRQRDPIMQFANKLIGGGAITGADAEELDQRALAVVDEAVRFADASPFPELDSLYDDVYVLGDQLRGWYSVDTRSPDTTRGESIHGDEAIQRLAAAGAAHDESEGADEQLIMRDGARRDLPAEGGAPPMSMAYAETAGAPVAEPPAEESWESPTGAEPPAEESWEPATAAEPPAEESWEPPTGAEPAAAEPPGQQAAPPPAQPGPAPQQPPQQPQQPPPVDHDLQPQPDEAVQFAPATAIPDDQPEPEPEIVFESMPHEEGDLSFGEEQQGQPAPLPLPPDAAPPPLPLPDEAPAPLPTPEESDEPRLLPPEDQS